MCVKDRGLPAYLGHPCLTQPSQPSTVPPVLPSGPGPDLFPILYPTWPFHLERCNLVLKADPRGSLEALVWLVILSPQAFSQALSEAS